MCVVSMVMQQWWPPGHHPDLVPMTPTAPLPQFIPQDPPPNAPIVTPNAIPWPLIQKDPELAAQMLEVLKRLEAIDRKLGLIEQCMVAEPEKRKAKARLRRIVKKVKSK